MTISIQLSRRDVFLIILALLVGFIIFTRLPGQVDKEPTKQQLDKFKTVYEIIRLNYVKEVSGDALLTRALKGMMTNLDPYSDYLTPEEYEELQTGIKGEFGGVGIEISMEDGILTVVTPLEDTPAFRAGILAGDRILEIDSKSAEGLSLTDSVRLIRGKPGTKVRLLVLHKGESRPVEIILTREVIKLNSVKDASIIDERNKVGYVRVTTFQEDTPQAFQSAVEGLREAGMKSLIVDLRFNSGGLLDSAVALSNKFIKSGVIVSTRGRIKESIQTFEAEPANATFAGIPLAVLVNGSSASASEIFAGAIQDYKKGTLIGTATYGKGSVQIPLELPGDKSAVKLTIAHYYTPSGKCLQRDKDKSHGLDPDVLVELTTEEETELIKARLKNDKDFKDKQLKKAIEVLTKR